MFDYLTPDYQPTWASRVERIAKLESDPLLLATMREYYKHNIADFVNDWGVTVNPKNAGTGRPVIMPFMLFPKQREFLNWVDGRFRQPGDGIVVKSRECGASWLCMSWAVSMCIFWNDVTFGFGSAIMDKVDNGGDPDSLFFKGRMFIRYLPKVFMPHWNEKRHSTEARMIFPWMGLNSVVGECGDKIGRGGRKTAYFVDEFAFVERPQLVNANLSSNTDVRIEVSTVNGLDNTFAERARGGLIERFDFHYRDNPTKVNLGDPRDVTFTPDGSKEPELIHVPTGALWPAFQEKKDKADPTMWRAEQEADFLASLEGQLIEADWIAAAVGFNEWAKIQTTGGKSLAYDVADEGKDKNAIVVRHGHEVIEVDQWSGTESHLGISVAKVLDVCDTHKLTDFTYDADGIGGGVKAIAARANEDRAQSKRKAVQAHKFHGSGAVLDPESLTPGTDRKNKDYLQNQKAQSWMSLRQRFLNTYRRRKGESFQPDNFISIRPGIKYFDQLVSELAQPTRTWSLTNKLVVDKTPDGVKSPNLGDAVMMAFKYGRPAMVWGQDLLDQL